MLKSVKDKINPHNFSWKTPIFESKQPMTK